MGNRIEAAARALCADRGIDPDDNEEFGRHFGKDHNWQAYIYLVSIVLAAADAATCVRVVPMPIPADRMETAKNTLLCWKSGALSDEEAIRMIVCGTATPPKTEVKE